MAVQNLNRSSVVLPFDATTMPGNSMERRKPSPKKESAPTAAVFSTQPQTEMSRDRKRYPEREILTDEEQELSVNSHLQKIFGTTDRKLINDILMKQYETETGGVTFEVEHASPDFPQDPFETLEDNQREEAAATRNRHDLSYPAGKRYGSESHEASKGSDNLKTLPDSKKQRANRGFLRRIKDFLSDN